MCAVGDEFFALHASDASTSPQQAEKEPAMNEHSIRVSRLVAVGAVGAIAATAVNAVIYGVGRSAGLMYIVSGAGSPGRVRLVDVITLSLISFAVGIVAAVAASRLRRPRLGLLQPLAAILAVVSTAMDLSLQSAASGATLASMHIVVGLVYVLTLRVVATSPSAATGEAAVGPVRAGVTGEYVAA